MCPYLFVALLGGLRITHNRKQPKLWPVVSLIRLCVPGGQCGTIFVSWGPCSVWHVLRGSRSQYSPGDWSRRVGWGTTDTWLFSNLPRNRMTRGPHGVRALNHPHSYASRLRDVAVILLFEIHKTHWAFVFQIQFWKLSPRAAHFSLIWYFQKSMPQSNLQEEIENASSSPQGMIFSSLGEFFAN